jgi:hypothetical protein
MDEDNQGGALNTAMDDTTDALGGLDVASIRAKQAAYKTAADDKKAFYDRMEKELLARRMGPTLSEKLLQMSAALLQPTTTRGFGASLGNLMPVLQQQAQQRREGEISRADALQKLQLAQLAGRQDLAGKELDTQVALARISAAQNKAGEAKFDALTGGGYQQRPGTGGMPPMPEMDRYGNYVITDVRQVSYLPVNAKIVEAGQDPTKPKYVPAR